MNKQVLQISGYFLRVVWTVLTAHCRADTAEIPVSTEHNLAVVNTAGIADKIEKIKK